MWLNSQKQKFSNQPPQNEKKEQKESHPSFKHEKQQQKHMKKTMSIATHEKYCLQLDKIFLQSVLLE